MKIKIPEGYHCDDSYKQCRFLDSGINRCCLFNKKVYEADHLHVVVLSKCQQCLNKEQIIIQYGEADENKTE